ncbi:hypothetical protein Val02_05720 [Virgisporangium aliadipatigenens]|uniref:Uncharacterized protein n=1 Tax=Virgisporangium aliadipatigenens TaxID=741659 RepID=A0A8J3YGS7_9ACTN|nr:hypothetical protein Val02_05720 [Virgisporangium aliadipatigenens]
MVLAAHHQWGERFVEHQAGMFAAVIADRGLLLALARLPNGSKTSLPFECLDLVVRGEDLSQPVVTDDLSGGRLLVRSFDAGAPEVVRPNRCQ